jgi:hypothetical protein
VESISFWFGPEILVREKKTNTHIVIIPPCQGYQPITETYECPTYVFNYYQEANDHYTQLGNTESLIYPLRLSFFFNHTRFGLHLFHLILPDGDWSLRHLYVGLYAPESCFLPPIPRASTPVLKALPEYSDPSSLDINGTS